MSKAVSTTCRKQGRGPESFQCQTISWEGDAHTGHTHAPVMARQGSSKGRGSLSSMEAGIILVGASNQLVKRLVY